MTAAGTRRCRHCGAELVTAPNDDRLIDVNGWTLCHEGAGGPHAETDPVDDLRDLLAAVLEAIDIPHPATTGDEAVYHAALARRAMHASIALRTTLEETGVGADPRVRAAYLRERLAEAPPDTYRHWEDRPCPGHVGRGTGAVCAVCGRPIPAARRRSADSPSEWRAGCADCAAGRVHVHGGAS